MTRQALEQLSKAELIELVLELQGQVTELKAELAQKSRPPKTPANSSVPPSAARKPNGKRSPGKGKKRGPKVGHVGKSRRRAEPDVVIECRLEECPDCGADLTEVEQRMVGSSQVVEIPPVQPVVVEAHRYSCTCPNCGESQVADYPPGMEPERVFGRRIEALVTYLHEVHHLSYARLQIVLQLLFSLAISVGALVNLVQRAAKRLEPAAESIREEIRGSRVVQSDETGTRVAGCNQWQWVFVTETATYHVIAPSRASGVIQEVMGNAVPVVWVRDLWSAQCKAIKSATLTSCATCSMPSMQNAPPGPTACSSCCCVPNVWSCIESNCRRHPGSALSPNWRRIVMPCWPGRSKVLRPKDCNGDI